MDNPQWIYSNFHNEEWKEILNLIPSILSLFIFLPSCIQWEKSEQKFQWTCCLCLMKFTSIILLFLVGISRQVVQAYFLLILDAGRLVDIFDLILSCLTFLALFIITIRFKCPSGSFQVLTCTGICIFSIPELIVGIISLIRDILSADVLIENILFMVLFALSFTVVILFSFSHFHISKDQVPEISPYENISFTSKIFFCYIWPLLLKGYKQTLTLKDLWNLDQPETVENTYSEFMKRYSHEKSLISVLWKIHWKNMLVSGFIFLMFHAFTVCYILIVLFMINLAMDPQEPRWHGYAYMGVFFILMELRGITLDNYFHQMSLIGLRCRSAFSAAIYRKALRLSPNARRQFTLGEIQNLVSVDSEWFCIGCLKVQLIWAAPLRFFISMYFLYYLAGHAAWPGIIIGVTMALVSLFVSKYLRKCLTKYMIEKDKRINAITEMVKNIKLMKLFAWEPSFHEKIQSIRTSEISHLKHSVYISEFSEIILTLIVPVSCLAIIGTYTIINTDVITPKMVFGVIAAFNAMYIPLIWLSTIFNTITTMSVVLNRLKRFLVAEELHHYITNDLPFNDTDTIPKAISISQGSFTWDQDTKFQLHDICMQVNQGQLIAIVGSVAAGKSSLLSALIGEMYLISGSVNMNGTVAYVPQSAWILNETFRQNITFGKDYERDKFETIVRCCCLEPDLQMLADGDMTEIGERGITLSGGQKQRLSLARAVYQDSDIYLLDDPLSAVDVGVKKQLFENVIGPNGLLNSKTRLLATHSVAFLPQCDVIIIVQDGKIIHSGTYEELRANRSIQYALQDIDTTEISETESDKLHNGQMSDEHKSIAPLQLKPIEESTLSTEASWSKLKLYLKASGFSLFAYSLFNWVSLSCWTMIIIWLQKWTDASVLSQITRAQSSISTGLGFNIFGILVGAQVLFAVCFVMCCASFSTRASAYIHSRMLDNLLHAPMSFFDATPTGGILNRYSKDLTTIDQQIPQGMTKVIQYTALVTLSVVPCIYAVPKFVAIFLPTAVCFYLLLLFFVRTSRQLRNLETTARAPVYTRFQETLRGVDSIRAYGKNQQFCAYQDGLINETTKAMITLKVTYSWVQTNIRHMMCIIITAGGALAVWQLSKNSLSVGMIGMCMVSLFVILDYAYFYATELTNVDTELVALERVNKYMHVKSEASWITERGCAMEKSWPHQGRIEFKEYSTRYKPQLPLALSNISLIFESGRKIGVVGRTGAGKSTLTLALYRILEPIEGSILIDDVDISQLGLHQLRTKLTIIPQEPCLFSGTLRRNLDPFNEYSDDVLWFALDSCNLKDYISNLPHGLETIVEEGGMNLSCGQRQLLCMGRAIIKKSKILILDEATASVDLETDALIQHTLRTQFSQCTLITIAHRLSTIMDYDMILVMDNGRVLEYAPTQRLLADENSAFRKMVNEATLAGVGDQQ